MKIYDWHIAPNPRRLHIFLAEKGIKVELVEVGQEDLTLAPWFKQKYPHAMVPMLELDDGTQIGEAMAIARYFEETHPEPPLMGTDAKDKAIVDMWEKRANEEGMLPGLRAVPQHASAVCRTRPAGRGRSRSRRFPSCAIAAEPGWSASLPNSIGNWRTTRSSPASALPSRMPPPWPRWISPAGQMSRSPTPASICNAGTWRSTSAQAPKPDSRTRRPMACSTLFAMNCGFNKPEAFGFPGHLSAR